MSFYGEIINMITIKTEKTVNQMQFYNTYSNRMETI